MPRALSAAAGSIGTIAVLPRGGEGGSHSAALGGEQLTVSRYSRNPDAAVSLVRFLTSPAEQRRRAIAGGFAPTIIALANDGEVLAANRAFAGLSVTLADAVARPSAVMGGCCNQVSAEFWNTIHAVLSGASGAEPALARLERTLEHIGRGGRW